MNFANAGIEYICKLYLSRPWESISKHLYSESWRRTKRSNEQMGPYIWSASKQVPSLKGELTQESTAHNQELPNKTTAAYPTSLNNENILQATCVARTMSVEIAPYAYENVQNRIMLIRKCCEEVLAIPASRTCALYIATVQSIGTAWTINISSASGYL